MHVWAVFVKTSRLFKKVHAILRATEGSPDVSAVSHALVHCQHCNGGLMSLVEGNVS